MVFLDNAMVLIYLFGLTVKHQHDVSMHISQLRKVALSHKQLRHDRLIFAEGCLYIIRLALHCFHRPMHFKRILDVDVRDNVSPHYQELVLHTVKLACFTQCVSNALRLGFNLLYIDFDVFFVLLFLHEILDLLSVSARHNNYFFYLVNQKKLNDVVKHGHIS